MPQPMRIHRGPCTYVLEMEEAPEPLRFVAFSGTVWYGELVVVRRDEYADQGHHAEKVLAMMNSWGDLTLDLVNAAIQHALVIGHKQGRAAKIERL